MPAKERKERATRLIAKYGMSGSKSTRKRIRWEKPELVRRKGKLRQIKGKMPTPRRSIEEKALAGARRMHEERIREEQEEINRGNMAFFQKELEEINKKLSYARSKYGPFATNSKELETKKMRIEERLQRLRGK